MTKRLNKIFAAFLALLLCVSVFGISAKAAGVYADVTEEQAIEYGEGLVEDIANITAQGQQADYATTDVLVNAFADWNTAMETLVSYQGLAGGDTAVIEDDSMTITVHILGENNRKATVVISLDDSGSYSSISTSVDDTFGEAITKAALNTVLGMGMAFFVLVLIALIIYFFFPVINRMGKKKDAPKAAPAAAPAPAAPVVEETVDDGELIAVIAAAVAASEGKTSTDGFVVRSIRRAKSRG